MKIKCKKIVGGVAKGEIIFSEKPINFLGMLDTQTGIITDENHDLYNQTIKDKILIFPNSIGSSVGAYTIFSLKSNKVSPSGILCTNIVDITTASGSAISKIPLGFINNETEKEKILRYVGNLNKKHVENMIVDLENEVIIVE